MNSLYGESEPKKGMLGSRTWLSVAAAAAVVTGAAWVGNVYEATRSTSIATPSTKVPENLEPMAVLAASRSEIANARDVIVHAIESEHDSANPRHKEVSHIWYDNSNEYNWRVDVTVGEGEIVSRLTSLVTKDGVKAQTLDFRARTVVEKTTSAPRPAYNFGGLGSSGVAYVGDEAVDGRPAMHFREATAGTTDYWIDPRSKLPIRVEVTSGTFKEVTDYEWLPRTDERIAELMPPIPVGFRVVPRPEPYVVGGGDDAPVITFDP